jgi:undecaprenyl diphosphate synthase
MVPSEQKRQPRHIAIIMDGNGRWARARGLPRSAGHRQGIEAVRRAVRAACDNGIEILTIYSFSTENWSRPKTEVNFLLDLLKRFIRQDVAELHANSVRIRIIGTRQQLEPSLIRLLEDAENLTRMNTGLTLQVAFNYGSRQEIAEAARKLAADAAMGRLSPADIDMQAFESRLDTAGQPDPDLLIRTGGEERISNFLLWQCAYAEFVFLPEYWPDFDEASFVRALDQYHARERRFGGLKASSA